MIPLYETVSESQFVAGTAFYFIIYYRLFLHVCESVCVQIACCDVYEICWNPAMIDLFTVDICWGSSIA